MDEHERVAGGEDGEREVRFAAKLTTRCAVVCVGRQGCSCRHGLSCTRAIADAAQKIEAATIPRWVFHDRSGLVSRPGQFVGPRCSACSEEARLQYLTMVLTISAGRGWPPAPLD